MTRGGAVGELIEVERKTVNLLQGEIKIKSIWISRRFL